MAGKTKEEEEDAGPEMLPLDQYHVRGLSCDASASTPPAPLSLMLLMLLLRLAPGEVTGRGSWRGPLLQRWESLLSY